MRTASELQNIFAIPVDTLTVYLQPGLYDLTAVPITDFTCGNCQDPRTPVDATAGLHIRGRKAHILGPADRSAVIRTHAGYGLFFEHCADGLVENLTIQSGERDTSGNATDAAIVVKNSTVTIHHNLITENIGDSAAVAKTMVGVMGICGRENAVMTVTQNDILRNSWDGIALYRDAVATIENNVIDGVDKARGPRIGGGRGVGIGVTWNGKAVIRHNLVTRYWKGIGLFVDASGVVEENIVEDIITWGMALWDADKGRPSGVFERNIIYRTGACGASVTRSQEGGDPGRFTGNIIVQTGQNRKYDSPGYYCYQCALALQAVPEGFLIDDNLFMNNRRATPDLPDHDIPYEEFVSSVRSRCARLSTLDVFAHSVFLNDFCRR